MDEETKKVLPIGNTFGTGGDEEDRTPGLGIANAALSQLSYIPKTVKSLEWRVESFKSRFRVFRSGTGGTHGTGWNTERYCVPAGKSEPFGSEAKA